LGQLFTDTDTVYDDTNVAFTNVNNNFTDGQKTSIGGGQIANFNNTAPGTDITMRYGYAGYGWIWKYEGSGAGNNNKHILYSEGAGGVDVQVYEMTQDGNTIFSKNLSALNLSGTNTGDQDLSGKVDNSQVLTNVPAGAVFTDTDTIYNDTSIQGEVDLNTAKETNVAHPLVETAVPVGALFTDNDTTPIKKGKANQVLLSDSYGNNYWGNNFSLKNSLKLCYVADTGLDNINKSSPIMVTFHDSTQKYIKVNLNNLDFLEEKGTNGEPWVLSLGGENIIYAEVLSVRQDYGEIYYTVKKGTFDPAPNEKIEFFNPFLNYELINRSPLLTLTDLASITSTTYDYLVTTALIEGDGYYELIIEAYGTTNAFYRAQSTNLQDWTFVGTELFPTYGGSGMEMASSPYRLDDGNLLVFASFKKTTPQWSSVIGIFDSIYNEIQTFGYVTFPKPADVIAQYEDTLEILDLIYFDGHFRAIVHYRKDDVDSNEITKEVVVKCEKTDVNVMKFLERGFLDSEYKWVDVQDSAMFNIFASSKNDGAKYVENNGTLSLFVSAEAANNGVGITSNNRLTGVATLRKGLTEDSEKWVYDKTSPAIINPMQLHYSYPDLDWTWDHLGRQMSFVIVNNTMYVFTSLGGDQSTFEYAPAGLKIELNH